MILTEKERTTIQDLQTQEESCVKKYKKYAEQACDPELKSLFERIEKDERRHYDSLSQVLKGNVPSSNTNDSQGKEYQPSAAYRGTSDAECKKQDSFLVTDCIGTEKLVSGEYNNNVFNCSDSDVRKLLADIQVEEQNHAEMLYKYKQANAM